MKKSIEKAEPPSGGSKNRVIREARKEPGRAESLKSRIREDDELQKKARLEAAERRRDRSRSVTMSFFVLAVMLLTVSLVLSIMRRSAPKPQFMFIQTGVIDHTVTSDAILIRDETLLKSPDNGILKPVLQAGSRVSTGQTAAVIIREGSEDDIAALRNYERQIADLQARLVMQGKGTGAAAIYEEADGSIAAQIDLVRRDGAMAVFTNFPAYRASVDVAMNRRDTRLLGIDFNDAELSELKKQKENLEKELGIVAGNVIVTRPGILSYTIDGMEKTLSPGSADTLTMDQFSECLGSVQPFLTAGELCKKDDTALKVISGVYQYIALTVPESADSTFKEGSTHTIRVPDAGVDIADCTVYRKVIKAGQLLILFRTDRMVVRFADARTVKVLLSIRTSEGLRIPYSSLADVGPDRRSGDIMLVVSGYVRRISVRIVDSDNEYAIIEAVADEDKARLDKGYLVKNPDSVKEGENIGG